MTEPIKLPPLPDWFDGYSEADKLVVQVYARAAIEAAIEADRAALQSQDREDAERYRHIRDNTTDSDGNVNEEMYVAVDTPDWPNQWALTGQDLDAAIDAAMEMHK